MRKRSIITALICSVCLTAGSAAPVMADASKVVTLGADLTQEQKNTMMRYFKADASQVQILRLRMKMREPSWVPISRWNRLEPGH